MTSTSDSKSRDPPISSTAKIEIIMIPNPSIVVTVFPSSTKSVDPQISSTTKVGTIMVQIHLLLKKSTLPTKFVGPLVSSIVTISIIIIPKPSIVDKFYSPPTKRVDPLPSSTVKSIIIIISNSSIVETVGITSTQSVAYMDIRVRHLEIEPSSSKKNKLYESKIKITCTISKLITIIILQNDIYVSRYRFVLVYCGKHLNDFNVNDKLSDHGIRKESFITMFTNCVMTIEMLIIK